MGAAVERPLATQNPRIIDYATKCRSEFMDVFLFSRCRFSVGDTAVLITIPITFNTPYIKTNVIPFTHLSRSRNALCILKKLSDTHTGRLMSIREIFNRHVDDYMHMEEYDKAGIEPVENTPEEIAEVTIEMHLRLSGQWAQSAEDDKLQER